MGRPIFLDKTDEDMNILVNGKNETVDDGLTLSNYLKLKNLDPDSVVVECNGTVVKKDEYMFCVIEELDTLEIVRFVGGG